jgi:hypothetical protein
MDESERTERAFGKLGHAIAKWEKEHPALHFRSFATTFDASKKGNLSQEELLKMLSKMRTASKVSDKDLAAVWTRLDKYRDPSSGFVKVGRRFRVKVSRRFREMDRRGCLAGSASYTKSSKDVALLSSRRTLVR